jgi:signal transduction histidine kinase
MAAAAEEEEEEDDKGHGTNGMAEGGRLASEIHDENARKLANMSLDEIAAAQAEIAQALDPQLLDMLRARARRQPPLPHVRRCLLHLSCTTA